VHSGYFLDLSFFPLAYFHSALGWRRLGPAREHFRRGLVGVLLLEVVAEEPGEVVGLLDVVSLVGPRGVRVEHRVRDAGARGGVEEVEGGALAHVRLDELAGVDRIQNGARVLERAALALLGAAQPARVEQPCLRARGGRELAA